MKLHLHTKKQIIAVLVMAVIFVIVVMYNKGYFDLTFVDRPNTLDNITTTDKQEESNNDTEEITENTESTPDETGEPENSANEPTQTNA